MQKQIFLSIVIAIYANFSNALQKQLALVIGKDGWPETIVLNDYSYQDCIDFVESVVDTTPIDEAYAKSILQECPKNTVDSIRGWQNCVTNDIRISAETIFLLGPSGSGKVLCGKAMAQELEIPCYVYNMAWFSSKAYWENLQPIFENAIKLNKPCMVIFKDIECFILKSDSFIDCSKALMLLEMIDRYDEYPIIFMITASSFDDFSINFLSKLADRFSLCKIALPNEDQRKIAFDSYMNNYKHKMAGKSIDRYELSRKLAEKTEGFGYREIKKIVHQGIRFSSSNLVKIDDFLMEIKTIEDANWKNASLYQKIKIIMKNHKVALFVMGIGIMVISFKQWNGK